MSQVERDEAMGSLQRDVYAPSNQHVVKYRWRTIERALALFGHVPFPPSVQKVLALGAVLKHGKYKSADVYLSLFKVECERAECPLGHRRCAHCAMHLAPPLAGSEDQYVLFLFLSSVFTFSRRLTRPSPSTDP